MHATLSAISSSAKSKSTRYQNYSDAMKKDTEEYRAYRRNMYRLHHPVRAGQSQKMTAYYSRSRASRMAEIARKQAIEDITDYVCKIYKVERRTAIAMLKDFFETE